MIVTLERSDSQRVIKRLSNAQVLDILNIRQLAKLFGMSESTVHWRMKEQKMTLEDALTLPLQSK
ncbi:sporulation transcriptional regulator SpoIIID [Yersinia enterocolitica]|uniref:sporulation transcriptional regulator SpoIIID n=1 Tax=Yersinia enterocolitica TaxID=630 RepID=UPI001E517574|nr:sporulation transcriptional regulator SpoIIID [Yersinia enterocolitica]MCE3081010.1 sporulation transcriptional regulator SpoIIID [Yersinia enterocolitica]